jgi:hypothetical protein
MSREIIMDEKLETYLFLSLPFWGRFGGGLLYIV